MLPVKLPMPPSPASEDPLTADPFCDWTLSCSSTAPFEESVRPTNDPSRLATAAAERSFLGSRPSTSTRQIFPFIPPALPALDDFAQEHTMFRAKGGTNHALGRRCGVGNIRIARALGRHPSPNLCVADGRPLRHRL